MNSNASPMYWRTQSRARVRDYEERKKKSFKYMKSCKSNTMPRNVTQFSPQTADHKARCQLRYQSWSGCQHLQRQTIDRKTIEIKYLSQTLKKTLKRKFQSNYVPEEQTGGSCREVKNETLQHGPVPTQQHESKTACYAPERFKPGGKKNK